MTSVDDKKKAVELISEAITSGARQIKACEILEISTRTYQRWEKDISKDRRKGAKKNVKNKLSDEERDEVVNTCCNSKYVDLTPYEIVPILAEKGIYLASESTFYRILRERKLLKHRSNTKVRQKREVIEVKATAPNQIWSWDITYLKTDIKGKFYYLYLFMDIWSKLIVGWGIYESESGQNASELIKEICETHNINDSDIRLHSDNGAPMKCSTMLATLQFLGVIPSFSRPKIKNDNAYSESLFKTLKYTTGYPGIFKTLEQAIEWMTNFESWYNCEHRHSQIAYVTPKQRHYGIDKEILEKRNATYKEAQKKNPERWSEKIRKWEAPKEVYIKKGNEKKIS